MLLVVMMWNVLHQLQFTSLQVYKFSEGCLAVKAVKQSIAYIRGGQPFEQEGQIWGLKVSAGQKSAQIKFGGPKTNIQIGKSL